MIPKPIYKHYTWFIITNHCLSQMTLLTDKLVIMKLTDLKTLYLGSTGLFLNTLKISAKRCIFNFGQDSDFWNVGNWLFNICSEHQHQCTIVHLICYSWYNKMHNKSLQGKNIPSILKGNIFHSFILAGKSRYATVLQFSDSMRLSCKNLWSFHSDAWLVKHFNQSTYHKQAFHHSITMAF